MDKKEVILLRILLFVLTPPEEKGMNFLLTFIFSKNDTKEEKLFPHFLMHVNSPLTQ